MNKEPEKVARTGLMRLNQSSLATNKRKEPDEESINTIDECMSSKRIKLN